MSYAVKYKSIFASYGEVEYNYHWPEELSEASRQCIQKILYDYNKLAFELEKADEESVEYSKNIYLFHFEEGSVLFCLQGYDGTPCSYASVAGMFIDREYLSTAWLMLDKLISFILVYDFSKDSLNGLVYENELDFITENIETNQDYSYIWTGVEEPFSFAIALLNPKLEEVKYFPFELSLDKILDGLDYFKVKNLEKVLATKSVYSVGTSYSNVSDYWIERYPEEKKKKSLFDYFPQKNKGINHSLWVMKKSTGTDSEITELKCLDDEKMVRFKKIKLAME